MLIQGNSLNTTAILELFSKAKADDECDTLDIRDVNFDNEETFAFVSTIRTKDWKSLRISSCSGLINDVVLACLSTSSQKVQSFHLQSIVNSQTIFGLSFGLKYAQSLIDLSLCIELDVTSANTFSKALARNTWLKSLKLSGSTIHSAAIGPIGFGLRLNRTLKSLSFDACYLEDNEMASLLMALQDHPTLKQLSIQQNACHSEGMAAISCLLNYNDLEELDMSYLVRKKKPPTPEPEPEPPAVTTTTEETSEESKNETVEETKESEGKDDETSNDADENKDGDDGENKEDDAEEKEEEEKLEEEEEKSWVNNKSLKVLQLAGNGLSDEFLESLLAIFGNSSALEELNLFGNRINDAGVNMIVRKLPKLKYLRSLWLGHNRFGISSAEALVDAVKTNYSLQDVNIRSMTTDPKWDSLQNELDYYSRLNRSGRRLFAVGSGSGSGGGSGSAAAAAAATTSNDQSSSSTSATAMPSFSSSSSPPQVPLSLWPLVLERANKLYWVDKNTGNGVYGKHPSYAADAIYCFLLGPVIFENPMFFPN